MAKLKNTNALVELADLDDAIQYHITLSRPIAGIDGRLLRPGPHIKSMVMSGAIVKRLASENPGAISDAQKA